MVPTANSFDLQSVALTPSCLNWDSVLLGLLLGLAICSAVFEKLLQSEEHQDVEGWDRETEIISFIVGCHP